MTAKSKGLDESGFQNLGIIYSLLFFLLGIALLVGSTYVTHELVSHLLRDMGLAALVGLYLMWTLERLNKRRVQAEVQEYIESVGENFISTVYGRFLPPALFDVIRRSLFDQSFLRTVYSIDLSLQNLTSAAIDSASGPVRDMLSAFVARADAESLDRQDLIVLQMTLYYEVRNVAAAADDYAVRLEIPKPFGREYEGLAGITSVSIDGREMISEAPYWGEESEGRNPNMVFFSEGVRMKPDQTIRVTLEAYSVRRMDDWEPWQTMVPSHGMTVRARDLDGDKDITLSLDAPLLEGEATYADKDQRTNRAVLMVSQYLLPFQGVTISWRRRRDAKEDGVE